MLALIFQLVLTPSFAQVLMRVSPPVPDLICTGDGLMVLSTGDILEIARAFVTPAEVQTFRQMISKCRADADAFLGGLLTALPTHAERVAFAEKFGVEDPVYGSPAEIAGQSRDLKALLMILAMRGLTPAELRIARSRLAFVTGAQRTKLDNYAMSVPRPVRLDAVLERWDQLRANCGDQLAQP